MPFTPSQDIVRSYVAPSSGSRFLTYSGTSGNLQVILIGDTEGLIQIPANENTLRLTNSLLSGLNEISVAQSGSWYLSNNSFQVALSGQNLVFATPSGTWNIGITGGTYLTGTNIVSFNNNSILVGESGNWQIGLSGNNLVQVTPSGVFTVRLETGSVNVNGTVNIGNSPTVIITQPLNVNSAQSGVYSVGQSGIWNVGLNAGSNLIGSVSQGSSFTTILTGLNVVRLETGNVTVQGTVSFDNQSIQVGRSGAWPVNLTGTNTITLNSGVLSTDINYVKSKSYLNSGLNTGLFSVKSTSGDITDVHLFNYNSQDVFLFLYDINTTNLSLATAPVLRKVWVPGKGAIDSSYDCPISCTGGISVCASLSVDTVVSTTSGLLVNIGYI